MTKTLSNGEIHDWLVAHLPSWELDGQEITRQFRTADWRVTLMTANAIGFLAEAAYHHPRLVLNYRSVDVYLTTHDAGGVTAKDLELAQRIEKTLNWPDPQTEHLDGPPADWLKS